MCLFVSLFVSFFLSIFKSQSTFFLLRRDGSVWVEPVLSSIKCASLISYISAS